MLPQILQRVKPFFSEVDIAKGRSWRAAVTVKLAEADAGIICLTPLSAKSYWLTIEAGALSIRGPVFTYLRDIDHAQVPDHLTDYQWTVADKEGTLQIIHALRGMMEVAPEESVVDKLFEKLWPDFSSALQTAEKDEPTKKENMAETIIEKVTGLDPETTALFETFSAFYGKRDGAAMKLWWSGLTAEQRVALLNSLADRRFYINELLQ